MLKNIFKRKPKEPAKYIVHGYNGEVFTFPSSPEFAKSYADYVESHRELTQELVEVRALLREANDHNTDLQEMVASMDRENSSLGNAMFEILNQDTPSSNATVKRIMAIAKSSLGIDVK